MIDATTELQVRQGLPPCSVKKLKKLSEAEQRLEGAAEKQAQSDTHITQLFTALQRAEGELAATASTHESSLVQHQLEKSLLAGEITKAKRKLSEAEQRLEAATEKQAQSDTHITQLFTALKRAEDVAEKNKTALVQHQLEKSLLAGEITKAKRKLSEAEQRLEAATEKQAQSDTHITQLFTALQRAEDEVAAMTKKHEASLALRKLEKSLGAVLDGAAVRTPVARNSDRSRDSSITDGGAERATSTVRAGAPPAPDVISDKGAIPNPSVQATAGSTPFCGLSSAEDANPTDVSSRLTNTPCRARSSSHHDSDVAPSESNHDGRAVVQPHIDTAAGASNAAAPTAVDTNTDEETRVAPDAVSRRTAGEQSVDAGVEASSRGSWDSYDREMSLLKQRLSGHLSSKNSPRLSRRDSSSATSHRDGVPVVPPRDS